MTLPKVSVLIPCYKQAKFLAEAVASVRAQTFTEWEAVIVASDEESRQAAWALLDERVRLVTHPPTGVCDARNVAARVSRGAFFLPLDADDTIDPEYLAAAVAAIGPAKYAIAHAGIRIAGTAKGEWCPTYAKDRMRAANCLPNSSLHTRALSAAAGGWDPAMLGFDDWAYWISCSRLDPTVTRLPGTMMTGRQWDGNRGVDLAPWKDVWAPMIRMRFPDLYPSKQEDRLAIATLGQGLRGRLAAQLVEFPTHPALREWLDLIDEQTPMPVVAPPARKAGDPIPKILHLCWIGPHDPPTKLIESWRDHHPSWRFKLWTDHTKGWENQAKIDAVNEWNGKCDIMRYEVLAREGGVFVDADSLCERELSDEFLQNEAFACYENEQAFPGLIACAAMGSVVGSAPMRACVEAVKRADMRKPAWDSVGPGLITRVALGDARGNAVMQRGVQALQLKTRGPGVGAHPGEYAPAQPTLRLYPARHFIPQHYSGVAAPGDATIYSKQLWGGTLGYDRIRPPCTCATCKKPGLPVWMMLHGGGGGGV